MSMPHRKAKQKTAGKPSGQQIVCTGLAALSLAGVCKAESLGDKTSEPSRGHEIAGQPTPQGQDKPVFVADDSLKLATDSESPAPLDEGGAFTLVRLDAFQKPPMEEALIEPDGTGACSCNTVCACVPVQNCSCNTVCTCDTVASCGAYSSGGGGGGGGYGGYFCYW
jgi:hypothetical protein